MSNIFEDTYNMSLDIKLQYNSINEKLEHPKYLYDKVKSFINEHKKGVLLFQLEAGMGKSTFIRSIDSQIPWGIKIEGVTSRAVYLNDKYNNSGVKLFSTIQSKFKQNNDGDLTIIGRVEKSHNKKKKIAELCGLYVKDCEAYFNTTKLLLIIDGVDEVQDSSIYEYIPNEKDLPNNCYLVITSRTNDEITDITKKNILEYSDKNENLVNDVILKKSREHQVD